MSRNRHWAGSCCFALSISCGYGWYDYEIEVQVTIAEDVEVPEGIEVFATISADETDEPLRQVEGGQELTAAGVRSYVIDGSVCCVPEPALTFEAFLDLDGDGRRGDDEPFGADPGNPVTLGTNDRRVVVSHIEITNP